jgi:hypothetical protein
MSETQGTDSSEAERASRARYVAPEILWEDDLGLRPGLIAGCVKNFIQNPACEMSSSQS